MFVRFDLANYILTQSNPVLIFTYSGPLGILGFDGKQITA